MRKVLALIVVIVFIFNNASNVFSQTNDKERIGIVEAELNYALQDLRMAKKDDQMRALNDTFQAIMDRVIEEDWFFDHPFLSLQSIGKIYSEDKEVRIISWNVQWEDNSNSYFAYVLKREKRKDGHFVVKLKDNSKMLPRQPKDILDPDNWYGALYYEIKDVQKGRKTYYTIFGFDANNDRSKIKLLDILHFTGKTVKLGHPFFETKDGWANRVYFEYSAKAAMSLKYDKKRDMIIFDHLSPESPGLAEFREYYIPDMSYDAYEFEETKWRLREDIIALNSKENEIVEMKAYDKDLDTVVSIPVKREWNNPEDPNAPIDGGGHRAVMPDDEKNNSEAKNKNDKNASSNDPDFRGVSYSNLNKKKKRKKKKKKD